MATAALRRAVTAMTRRPSDPPDADLLRRFTADRSEDAFAALVRRHGPLVLGVCRRVVPDTHLADDAFQAAFVVLARRAGGIDPARPLGPWLYGVAHRVALRARTMIGRRRKRETLAAAVPEVPHPPPAVDDASTVLDEEIGKLPAASRDAVILCELQGLSRREAATRLGIAEGTLSSRLAAARKTLATRLQSRGVVLSVALASAAVVPSDLVAATVAAGTGVSLSSVVVSLADGASAMTLLNKLKLATVAAVFAVSALGYGLWPAGETAAAPVPKEKRAAGLIWVLDPEAGKLIAYTPDGKEAKAVKLAEKDFDPTHFLGITADGQRAMLAVRTGVVFHDEDTDPRGQPVFKVHLLPLHEAGKPTDTGIDYAAASGRTADTLITSADGQFVYRCREVTKPGAERGTWAVTRFDLTGKNPKEIALPDHMRLTAVLPDGNFLLEEYRPTEVPKYRAYRFTPGGKPVLVSGEVDVEFPSLSPDGRTLLATAVHTRPHTVPADGEYRKLVALDPATGKPTRLDARTNTAGVVGFWSPDGKRVAVEWHERVEHKQPGGLKGAGRCGGGEIGVCSADGCDFTRLLPLDDPGDDGPAATDLRHRKRLIGWFPSAPLAKKDALHAKPVKEPIKAPVPPVKAKLPTKLDRPPDAPEALRKELAGWDATYRHQSEEKFAELEKRAEELAKEQTDKHDEARVWYAVAHVAAQSDIGKHAERVRKYAERCLKLSRDPLDRAHLYSYLASCEELSKGEPADRRQKATDWLLTGYLELLAQELPDEKPALPQLVEREGFRPRNAAQEAAQKAVWEEANFVGNQITRRDVLVLHLRNLYGRDLDALRTAAEAKLPKADDVDKLLERVLPKK